MYLTSELEFSTEAENSLNQGYKTEDPVKF